LVKTMNENDLTRLFRTAEKIISDYPASELSNSDTPEKDRYLACKMFMMEISDAAADLDAKLKKLSE